MASTPSGATGPSSPNLIGRGDELALLADVAERAAGGAAQMALLSGDAGIGKSTLVAQFVAGLCRHGWSGHIGHCIEYADRPLPFGPVVGILRSLLLSHLDDVDELVDHRRADLASLLPELTGGDAGTVAGGASLAGDVDRLFDAISTTLTAAARHRPAAVVVEDIHWADAATRDLLASLVHSLGSAPVLLIATERSGAVPRSHPLRTWLAEQRRFPNVTSLTLDGLSRGELAQQAASILGHDPDDALVDGLAERTGGNPYFAHELLLAHSHHRRDGDGASGDRAGPGGTGRDGAGGGLAAGIEALPSSLADFLTSRLERLSDDEREVLRAVAVAGGKVSHTMLTAILPELPVGGIVRNLYDASILVVDGSDYTFWHGLLRSAILGGLLPFESEDLHRRAAEALTADPSRGSSPSDLANLALHWGHANDPDRSLTAAVEAADASAAVAAYEAAAEMALQALRAWPLARGPDERTGRSRDQLTLDAAEWLANCYRGEDAVDLVRGALAGWARDLPAGRRALLAAKLAPIEYHLGRPTDAVELLAQAEQLVGDEISPEAAQVHNRISKQAVADGHIDPALEAAERAIEIASSQGPPVVLVEALTTRALAVGVTRDLDEGVALVREARQLALDGGFVSQVANTYRVEMLVILFRRGRTADGLDASRKGLEYAEGHCGPRWRAEFRLDLCLGLVEAGRLADAPPLLAVMLASRLDDLRRLTVLQVAGLHAMSTGSIDEAGRFLADATQIADRYQSPQETGYQNRLLAELARRESRLDDAVELIDKALKLQLASDNLTYTRESIIEKLRIVRACIASGWVDVSELRADVAELVSGFDGPGEANVAFRSLMDLELASLDQPVDLDAAGETIEQLEASGFLHEGAQARLLVIDRLIGSGPDRERLERDLIALAEIATANGMTWIAGRVAALAKAARLEIDVQVGVEGDVAGTGTVEGTTLDQGDPGAVLPHGLTAREVEVLSLLAEGLTNKAIGERLYVSPRTVSTHVSNLLAKLHVENRGEAAAAYYRLGLDSLVDLP